MPVGCGLSQTQATEAQWEAARPDGASAWPRSVARQRVTAESYEAAYSAVAAGGRAVVGLRGGTVVQ